MRAFGGPGYGPSPWVQSRQFNSSLFTIELRSNCGDVIVLTMPKAKVRRESAKSTLARVTKEMGEPRMSKSAREGTAKLKDRARAKRAAAAD